MTTMMTAAHTTTMTTMTTRDPRRNDNALNIQSDLLKKEDPKVVEHHRKGVKVTIQYLTYQHTGSGECILMRSPVSDRHLAAIDVQTFVAEGEPTVMNAVTGFGLSWSVQPEGEMNGPDGRFE